MILTPLIGYASAATWQVGTDAATITETIALAASGDTVEVPAGTWAECVDTAGKSLTLTGAGTIDGTGLCDNTVRVVAGETVTISGLTVRNTAGRAFHIEWSTATLDGVTVTGTGRSDWSGGGIWAYGAALTTTGCTFQGNVAWEGAGVYLYAYATWNDVGSTFADNASAGTGGGAMAYYDNAVTLTGSVFTGNTSGYYGGAVATWDYSDLTVRGATFAGNAAPGTGGGALMFYPVDSGYGVLDIADSTFVDNTGTDGGALWVGWASTVGIATTTFTRNVATGSGGGLLAYVTGTTTLRGNTFCGNSAGSGGGASVQWTNVDTWANNVFVGNTAAYGGGAHRYASYAGDLRQGTFVGNSATVSGGAYAASWSYGAWTNTVVAHTSAGTGIYTGEAATEANSPVTYGGWYENAVADGSGYFWVENGAGGNVVADPGFVAWSADDDCDNDDLRLRGDSAFKDQGDPAIFDLDGSRSDIGAYGGPGQPTADRDGDGADTTTDCDDTSDARHPGAAEVCDGVDDDCDGLVDNDAPGGSTFYADADGDGFGDPSASVVACDLPDGAVDNADDCDDTDRWANPDASDLPGDGVDADCSGADNVQYLGEPAAEDTGLDGGDGGSDAGGCGCTSVTPAGSGVGLVLAAVALLRRRRARR
ncbi:MAG: MopE-related protein [Pseudomonadota bacterium]|nr:MopE-related protein [Pseudomonadota bacterium]